MVGPEAMVMDLASGRTVGLNATGSFIWSHLAKGSDDGLVEAFASEFRVPVEFARSEVGRFIEYLGLHNLIAKEP
jgi:hypothetical protein